ncbi:uncharacterized protein PHACADRAFT_200032 [Phanerochaete carnosa HHB-10118-sp]|uniref:DUF6534 domain-containing protein n=1 Tax=Phanerochaete carnosa (strain HHB-10118-sp) TaxID=650164 RepID=K5VWM4_PHACS|nr:uncharacterized protein PHACADRAFT_200032 [Phanerochaete carnosa HHB-10118-sp]EKM51210.1 hypothetical protein PHACADRAFT_200032 [Phanerochaete carnosa HHB-10118-sp]
MNPAEAAQGPGLIGAFLNVFLFGIVTAQVFHYYSTYKKDRIWIKLYVAVLYVADLLNSIFDIYWLYNDLVAQFGNVANLNDANWRIATDPAMVAIIATGVQLFYAWRVKVLMKSWWVASLIIVTAVISCCGGLGVAIAVVWVQHYSDFSKFDQTGAIWLVSTAVCDTTIAVALTWHLRRYKTGFQRTDDILNKIVLHTFSTGAITAIWAIIDLILFLSISTGIHLIFNLPLAKLYTNSLMSSLNSRSGWKFGAELDRDARNTSEPVKSSAMPEFLHLSTHAAASRPEVQSCPPASLDFPETNVPEQVMVHVESHEMVDVSNEAKWPVETRGKRTSTPVYKVQAMV